MNGSNWRIEDPEPYPAPPGVVQGTWVSLHYLRSALQRKWWVIATMATAGVMLALSAMFLLPGSTTASSTVLLTHSPTDDPATAIQIDQSLLGTRTVSESVVRQLGLSVTPDELRSSFTSNQLSTELVEIELKAPTAQEAVSRLNALATTFLEFRNTQLKGQTDHAIQANDEQVSRLQTSVDELTRQYNSALANGQGQVASDALNRKSQLLTQIATLQSENQAAQVQVDSVTSASHVIDSAAVVPVSTLKRLILGVMSGLILGGGLAVAGVFGHTLLSNKLRRREDVATALSRPVAFSAGPVRGHVPWTASKRRRNLGVLAKGLASLVPMDGSSREGIALIGVGDLPSAASVLLAAARHLKASGDRVFLVDLTTQGWLMKKVGRASDDLPVHRPQEHGGPTSGRLSIASSADTGPPEDDPLHEEWDAADVVLVLGEVELGIGSGHLGIWADRCVLMVGAGKATAELLRSVSRMLTRSGPPLEFAMLVGADRTDQSLGLPRRVAVDEPQRRAR
jgi:capsular polysaccharide biosynthesis protein